MCFLVHHHPENNHHLGQSGLRGSKATGLPSLRSRAFWRTQPRDLHPLSVGPCRAQKSHLGPDFHVTPQGQLLHGKASKWGGHVLLARGLFSDDDQY